MKLFSPNTSSKSDSYAVDVLVANLHEDGTGVGQQVAGHSEAVAQVGQVGVDAVAPGVPEGLDLLRLPGNVGGALPSRTSRLVVDHWKLELNLDTVRRVDVDALYPALQSFPAGQ